MIDAQRIRHLEQQLAACDDIGTVEQRHKRVDILNELAWLLSDTDMQRAHALAETAYALSNTSKSKTAKSITSKTNITNEDHNYEIGIAYSLRTQGYLNMRFGSFSLGLTQLLRALPLVETLQLHDCLPDVFDCIAGIYCYIGSYPEALDAAYKQIEAAQRIDDPKRIINANNNLAVIYFETGEQERSQETLRLNLQLAREITHTRVECITYINLAEMHLLEDDYEIAVEHALRGLQMSQEFSYQLFEVHALHILGQCYRKMADGSRAIAYLERAVALSQTLESKATEILALLTLGEVHRDLHQLEQAQAYVRQAITTAQSIEAHKEILQGHLLLSELYEETGDLPEALTHFKEYQVLKERVFNEKADERLKVIQVAYETAAAKHDAELARLKTVDLQREITEHTRARTQLQRQLDYMRALSEFKQTLLAPAVTETDSRCILMEALRHLLQPTQARVLTIHRNMDDPELGPYSQMFVHTMGDISKSLPEADTHEAIAAEYQTFLTRALPGLSEYSAEFISTVFPRSLIPSVVNRQLMAGTRTSGTITELFANTPAFRDFLIQKLHLHALLLFPIYIDGQWWGTMVMARATGQQGQDIVEPMHLDSQAADLWTEDEILMLGTATEMIASAIQRWQAEANLSSLNDQLEKQVMERTAELHDTVVQLRAEIEERQRAEAALQEITATLEQRLADRTQELATFFDLTVIAESSDDFHEVLEQALPRILEVTHSRAVSIHLFDADRQKLLLTAQQDIPQPSRLQLDSVPLSPHFQSWLEEPHEPLLTTTLSQLEMVPPSFRLADFQTYLGVQISVGAHVEGILSCYRFTERGFGLDEIALLTAIGEQMGMVIETYRLRRQTAELAALEERQRLARDLHDSATQSLFSLSLFSRAGREAVEDNDFDRLQHSLTQVEETALYTLRDMRLLLYELRPMDLASEGLRPAIERRLDMVERRIGLRVDVRFDELGYILYSDETELFYIITEALNNVIKHAAATHLTVQLNQEDGHLQVQIVDNGQGFNPSQPTGGLGLRNIRERVSRLSGEFAIYSEPGNGTRLEVIIPH